MCSKISGKYNNEQVRLNSTAQYLERGGGVFMHYTSVRLNFISVQCQEGNSSGGHIRLSLVNHLIIIFLKDIF